MYSNYNLPGGFKYKKMGVVNEIDLFCLVTQNIQAKLFKKTSLMLISSWKLQSPQIATNLLLLLLDEAILQQDLIEIMPGVEEANSIGEALDKNRRFDLVIVSPEARGELTGRTEVRTYVIYLSICCNKYRQHQGKHTFQSTSVWFAV